jgi:hypothetical protein
MKPVLDALVAAGCLLGDQPESLELSVSQRTVKLHLPKLGWVGVVDVELSEENACSVVRPGGFG